MDTAAFSDAFVDYKTFYLFHFSEYFVIANKSCGSTSDC